MDDWSKWKRESCRFQAYTGFCLGVVLVLFCFVGWKAVLTLPMPLMFTLLCLSEPNQGYLNRPARVPGRGEG